MTMLKPSLFLLTTLPFLLFSDTAMTSRQLWLRYAANPDNDPNIPNVSYAGYHRGERPLPRPPVVTNVRDTGAKGDGVTDDSAAFRMAIDQAAARGGGTVLVPPGTYLLNEVLHLNHSRVVLLGAGSDQSTLLFGRSLTQAIGERRSSSGHASAWSWMGGMVWVGPDNTFDNEGRIVSREGWPVGDTLANVRQPAVRGDRTLTVDTPAALREGQFVLMSWKNPGDLSLLHEIAGHALMKEYNWHQDAAALVRMSRWRWPVQIERIQGDQITLAQPLRIDVRPEWEVQFHEIETVIEEVGIEGLTLKFENPRPVERHLEDIGNNGIYLNRAINCWVHDVVIEGAENGLIHAAAKQTTTARLTLRGPRMHHATALRMGSHDNLITDFTVEAPVMHGINTESLSTGNVWRRGDMRHGTFDSHRAMSWDFVRTDITLHNDGRPGGGNTAGPLHGRRVVHWNIRVTNHQAEWVLQPDMISQGALVGIQGVQPTDKPAWAMVPGDKDCIVSDTGRVPTPPDLYEAQFQLRTNRPPNLGR
ncbi:MAG: hypothetical protein JJU29_19655 [Verrucomicrobia bacterium]|nr:hypothetical protein [Verrucomicrobiota bacterium]MCH8512352.1 glycoside hydrolase family 55 protein [Kiritimatiellia bacterium]